MEEIIKNSIAEVGITLTTLAFKGTASAINTKIKSIKLEKDVETVKNRYEEIISELLSEREEAIRIAQIYKGEIERYQISDDDITHLHKTVDSILQILQGMNPQTNMASLNPLKDLISIDTLKAIQLLGFNYKEAIGEPLTKACADAIHSWSSKQQRPTNQKK